MNKGLAPDDAAVEAALLYIVQERGNNASACPSEVARSLSADNWRRLMPHVRQVALRLAQGRHIEITQKGQVLPPGAVIKGPIRLRLPRE